MADDNKKRAVVDKWKKKRQFKLLAPKYFGNSEFGETVSVKPEQLVGRLVKLNMSILTNQVKSRNTDAILRISKVEGSNAQTDFAGYIIKTSSLRRMFRRRTSKIEIVDTLESKDKQKIKIKFVAVTFGKQEVSKTKLIRKELETFMRKTASENSTEKFLELCMNTKDLFAEVLTKIKKISPISLIEIERVKAIYK
jgi:ribosomal protein S3AE